jgi:tryptophan synthase alpha chain
MSNIANAFKNGKAFIGFVTGGDPTIEKSCEFILEMARAGADLVEIGIPFSDPIAEGPVIQEANIRALRAGATVAKMFDIVCAVRKKTNVPLVFLTYFNPVFKYGPDLFFAKCAACGLDGIIIPDLPYEESILPVSCETGATQSASRGQRSIKEAAAAHGVDLISLVAPTSEKRIAEIARNAAGFLYVVSSMGVTGIRSAIETDLGSILKTVKAASDIPAAVGFGINTPEQAAQISRIADGVIVGSAIVKIVAAHGADAGPHIYEYVKTMKDAISKN